MPDVRPAWLRPLPQRTDLPVLLPVRPVRTADERLLGVPMLRLRAWMGVALLVVLVASIGIAEAQSPAARASIVDTLLKWSPLLWKGFVFNIAISFLAMAIGTVLGAVLGLMQISLLLPVRKGAWLATHFFRNSPWLVLLFYCMFLLPFKVTVFGVTIPIPDWVKATFGLSLPVMANVSEIVRGAVQSIPTGQWESAYSLAFNRRQTLWMIILPQCLKRMLPPWMNVYAILAVGTVLASVVGVSEVMTLTGDVLSAENRRELLIPFYTYVLIMFFLYCYPIARYTVYLERKWQVNQ